MSEVKDFSLPDLGEGLTESEIVSWRVNVGDTVELNQVIAEVETAKALVELPSPFAGIISKLYVEPGSTVPVGAPILAFEVDEPGPEPEATGRTPVLVGYGPKIESGERPKRKVRADGATKIPSSSNTDSKHAVSERPRSTPPVRKLARDRGVDLTRVTGTGDDGLITREDVRESLDATDTAVEPTVGAAVSRERRVPMEGVRKRTAEAMVASAFTAPHVTEFLTVDVSPTMELIASLHQTHEFQNRRLNILTVIAKALCLAVRRTPQVNAHLDDERQEIVEYGYLNLGIAAATPRGLLVPNIPDADTKSLAELSDEIASLAATARGGETTPARLHGGTISVTNIGVFGIDAGTPILNPGEATILCVGAVRTRPWEYRGGIALREVMTLSVSFDHRIVDGEQASRFLADIGTVLSAPAQVLAML